MRAETSIFSTPEDRAKADAKWVSENTFKKVFQFSSLRIELKQTAVRGETGNEKSGTSDASIEVRKDEKSAPIQSLKLDGIDSVGGIAGIFYPEKQPIPSVFLISKEGGYDPRLIVVDHQGKIFNLPSQSTALSLDHHWLFTWVDSEVYGGRFAVFDLVASKVVVQGENTQHKYWLQETDGESYGMFVKDETYFARMIENRGKKDEKAYYLVFDLKKGTAETREGKRDSKLDKGAKPLIGFSPVKWKSVSEK